VRHDVLFYRNPRRHIPEEKIFTGTTMTVVPIYHIVPCHILESNNSICHIREW